MLHVADGFCSAELSLSLHALQVTRVKQTGADLPIARALRPAEWSFRTAQSSRR